MIQPRSLDMVFKSIAQEDNPMNVKLSTPTEAYNCFGTHLGT